MSIVMRKSTVMMIVMMGKNMKIIVIMMSRL